MSPQTENNINETIDWLQETGASVQQFTETQAPLYCKEVVTWEIIGNSLPLIAGSVILLLCLLTFVQLIRKKWDDQELYSVAGWFSVIGLIFLAMGSCGIVKAIVAPRLVIVEHLQELKKGASK